MDKNHDIEHKIFSKTKNIAFIGLSDKPGRASNRIGRYLIKAGFSVFPVHHKVSHEILGLRVYRDIREIKKPIDLVLLFLNKDVVSNIADEILNLKPKAIWLPEGITNNYLEQRSKENNILFVMDKCIYKEHVKYLKADKNGISGK